MNVKPIGYSVYPNIMFTMEGGNTEKYFDIVTHESSGNRGKNPFDRLLQFLLQYGHVGV